MANLTQLLKTAISNDFARYLLQQGFRPGKKTPGIYSTYRRSGLQREDLIEIQFDKNQRPKFVLNFGVVPSEGIVDAYGRFLSSDKVEVAHLIENGSLYSCPYSNIWFSTNTLLGLRKPESSVITVITHLIKVFKQVDRWFNNGISGPNIWIYSNSWNAPNARRKSMLERGVWPPDGWTEEDDKASSERGKLG